MPDLLADLTTLRLGGPARRIATPRDTNELVATIRSADEQSEPVLVVGGGSNLVIGDDGWDGLVVLVRTDTVDIRTQGDTALLTADAGVSWDELVARTVDDGFSGLAAMSGIPGSTGGTPVQNVGAYGREVADVIDHVRVLDRESGAAEDWSKERCAFAFRTSAFKHTDRYVVLSVTFELEISDDAPPVQYAELARRLEIEPGDAAPSSLVREVVLDLRRGKGMVLDESDHDTWSVGSFFVNMLVDEADVPPGCPHWPTDGRMKLSAAWLIENAGFGKGFGLDRPPGTVAVSTKHTLALTNRGGATTADLLDLARVVRDGVEDRFGLRLYPEAHLVGVEL